MKEWRLLIGMMIFAVGCGPPADLEGPAPAGVLDCTLAYALEAGYQLVDGGPDDGFLRLVQRTPQRPVDARPTGADRLGDAATVQPAEYASENQLLVEVAGDRTRYTVIGNADQEGLTASGSTAAEQARTMRDLCTSTPPGFPDPVDTPTSPPPPGAPLQVLPPEIL